jgi:hypothetical protein
MRHDYSRNPAAQMAWVVFLNLAIAVEHLFIYTTTSIKLRKEMSIKDFMEDLFHEVRFMCKKKINKITNFLKNIKFKFTFSFIRKPKIWAKIEQFG